MQNIVNQPLELKMIRGIKNTVSTIRGKRPRSVAAIVETTPYGIVVHEPIQGVDVLDVFPGRGYKETCPKTGRVYTRFNPNHARQEIQSETLEPRYYNFGRMENIVYVDENRQFINSIGMRRKPSIILAGEETFDDVLFLEMALAASDTFISKNYRNPEVCILWENEDNRLERNY